MDSFYNDFPERSKRKTHFWKGVLLGSLVGGLIVATVFFYFAGTLLSREYTAPPLTQDSEERNGNEESYVPLDISPQAMEYYLAVVNAAERATPPVVGISNFGVVYDFFGRGSLQQRSSGSGVIIRSDGYIVTNYHVIENSRELVVSLGSGEEFPATVVGADPPTDLAVIKIDKKGLPTAKMADSDKLRVGEPAIAIGNPLGLDFQQSVTKGVVSALERSITIQGQNFSFIQTDAAINDGNSGGALVNIKGELIGINTAKIKISGVEGMGFAIPSNTVKQISNTLIEKGRVVRPWIGVYISTLTPFDAQRFGLSVQSGILVQEVVKGGPADRAGIVSMDVILEIEGTKLTDISQLQQLLQKFSVGETVEIILARGQEKLVVPVTLDELPENMD
ncbi:MAG: PDZ domain-containing protein [Firmicutes bacterium]|nr:PDZ domain-containing protein [Bacillota bacterium]